MAYEFRLPDLGEGLTEGEVARWLVAEGENVGEDDPLLEIQTDKTTVEIPSPAAGRVSRICVEEGATVPVGTLLVVIGEDGPPPDGGQPRAEPAPQQSAASASPVSARRSEGARVRATPLVRRLAGELGVDLATVPATGPQGRVTEADVRRAVERPGAAPPAEPPGADGAASAKAERREPLRGVRRLIADHLTTAHREIPAVTVVEECDFGELEAARGERSYLPYLLSATVHGLRGVPELNARLEGDEIVYSARFDLGIAVQTEKGLVVPVVRGADARSLDELERETARLAEAARAGTLALEELRGSTFTVSSGGKLGGLFATPLVNYPEVGILGLHRIREQPVVREGEIVAGRVGWLSCTFDHRVVDGVRASAFLLDVIARLERPE
ncbi:MAG: 2-oxo acid dehydrogenase subunit E2 [Thermoleophilia bacterium]|nr:2-oxo acid dehydrogenase subunit E2 [Thermoleophilia bacterium]